MSSQSVMLIFDDHMGWYFGAVFVDGILSHAAPAYHLIVKARTIEDARGWRKLYPHWRVITLAL